MIDLEPSGYRVLEQRLPTSTLERLKAEVARLVALQGEAHAVENVALGSLINLKASPFFLELLDLKLLPDSARFTGGYIFNKPPGAPGGYWHQDWYFWKDPMSRERMPPQIGLLFYLADTDAQSGALRVIPSSRFQRHPLHDVLEKADKLSLRKGIGDPALFAFAEAEQTISVSAGSVIAMDARLLHSTHPHRGAQPRPLITLWFITDENNLSPATRSAWGSPVPPEDWPEEARKKLEPHLMRYAGVEAPAPVDESGP